MSTTPKHAPPVSSDLLYDACRQARIDGIIQAGVGQAREIDALLATVSPGPGPLPLVGFDPIWQAPDYPGVRVVKALGDRRGHATLFCRNEQSSLRPIKRDTVARTVIVSTLDVELPQVTTMRHVSRALLWIDVQGAELELIRGAEQTLLTRVSVVMVECHARQKAAPDDAPTREAIIAALPAFAHVGMISRHEMVFVRR